MLNTNHIDDLLMYGAARLAMERKDKSKCEKSLCSSGAIGKATDKICNGEPIRYLFPKYNLPLRSKLKNIQNSHSSPSGSREIRCKTSPYFFRHHVCF